jgi:hypothetical protein
MGQRSELLRYSITSWAQGTDYERKPLRRPHAFRYRSERQIRDPFFYTIQRSSRRERRRHVWECKKTDVVAVEGGSACAIEVKTTQEARWIIGCTVPEPGNSIWVLVYLPRDDLAPAEFFVLTSSDLHTLLKPVQDAWLKKWHRLFARFRQLHGPRALPPVSTSKNPVRS